MRKSLILLCVVAFAFPGCLSPARNPGQSTNVSADGVETQGPGRNPFKVNANEVAGDAGYPATNATMVYPTSDVTDAQGNVTVPGKPFQITGHTPGSATILANDLTQTAALIPGRAGAAKITVYTEAGEKVAELIDAEIDNTGTLSALATWQTAVNPAIMKFSDDQREAYVRAVVEANASLQKAIDLVMPISEAAAKVLESYKLPVPVL